MSQEAYAQSCRDLAIANGNHRLYRLKKDDLLKVCNHYGVEIRKNPNGPSRTTATKNVLEVRIIEHRDKIYEQDPESVVSPYNNDAVARRAEMVRLISKIISEYSFSFTNQSFHGYIAVKFSTQRIMRESKINLAIIYLLLKKVDNDDDFRGRLDSVTNTEIYDIYFSPNFEHRNAYYEEIQLKVSSLRQKTQAFVQQQRRQEDAQVVETAQTRTHIKVKNDTGQSVYLWWCYKVDGFNDECRYLSTIRPGETFSVRYVYDCTQIISTTVFNGANNITDYNVLKNHIISENNVTEKNPETNMLSIKPQKPEIERWKEAALKCDFLMKQLKRLGIEKYDHLTAIVDMHQDIVIPDHTERDKDNAGIPSAFTNVT